MDSVISIEIEIAPAAVDVLGFEKHLDLFVGKLFESGDFGFVTFAIFDEVGNGAKSVSVAPNVVGCGGIEVAEFWEFIEEPGFGFINGCNDFGPPIIAIEEATEGEGGSASAKGEMRVGNGSVDVESFGPGGASP